MMKIPTQAEVMALEDSTSQLWKAYDEARRNIELEFENRLRMIDPLKQEWLKAEHDMKLAKSVYMYAQKEDK